MSSRSTCYCPVGCYLGNRGRVVAEITSKGGGFEVVMDNHCLRVI